MTINNINPTIMKPMTYDGVVSLRALTDMSISTHKRSWTARLQRAARTDEETSTDRSAYNIISLISRCEVDDIPIAIICKMTAMQVALELVCVLIRPFAESPGSSLIW